MKNLITLGDIELKKEDKKFKSICHQNKNRFDYHGIENALSGKSERENFTPKRIIVIQMI